MESLILRFEEYNKELTQSFKNLVFKMSESKDQTKFIIISGEKEAPLAIGEKSINEVGLFLWENLLRLSESFLRRKEDFLKFRGDLVEVIFLYFHGGKKIYSNSSADILLNQQIIEIKSSFTTKRNDHNF